LRLIVVSPFLDRRHGTELCIVEQIERLAYVSGWAIHVYSQRVEDVRISSTSCGLSDAGICWHKISSIPGPHLLKYLWWFCANQLRRRRDTRTSANQSQIVYSPGINCFDADAVVVHIVFHELHARVWRALQLRHLPPTKWFLAIHRRLYYRLIMALERHIYTNDRIRLAAVSRSVANQLRTRFGREDVVVIPNAVDIEKFQPERRVGRRHDARRSFGIVDPHFVLLLIGNDWKNKGLDVLMRAMSIGSDLPLLLLVVGSDSPGLYSTLINELRLKDRVRFLSPSADVLQFYAAADAYVGPSLEDAFGLPILEAMACGLPVIASVFAGASENIQQGQNGLLLSDPEDARQLEGLIRDLATNAKLCEKLGEAAWSYVQGHCTWDQNASRTREFLESVSSTLPQHAKTVIPNGSDSLEKTRQH
jgi:glycosyltransferase involved in cell wall biosynthesis